MAFAPEFLAMELKKLVGWGAKPARLAQSPILRSFAGLPAEAVNFKRDGLVIRRKLVSAIDSLSGTREFHGQLVPAEKMRRALKLLLMLEGSGQDAVERRGRAITVLGVYCTVDTWRRPYGAEWELLLMLAEHMAPHLSQTTA